MIKEVIKMKVVVVNIDKGGTGKTTFTYNFAHWLGSQHNKKVLLIDADTSCDLTRAFPVQSSNSVLGIFTKSEVKIDIFDKNVDLISGSVNLTDDYLDIKSKQNYYMGFFIWITKNISMLNEKYDYIIVDTKNDKSIVAKNFLVAADVILGISEPSINALTAWYRLKQTVHSLKAECVDPLTEKSYVTADAYLIGNAVPHIGTAGKSFIEMAEKESNYIGMIQSKELFRHTLALQKDIFELKKGLSNAEKSRNEAFYTHLNDVYNKIKVKIDEI